MQENIVIANQENPTVGVDLHEAARQFITRALKAVSRPKPSPSVVAFYGKMGAGKTTFIKALCEELGVEDVITSPTFAIANEYTIEESGESIYHFDFYRIKRLEEVYDMGYEDYFYSGNLWPELIEEILPDEAIRVTIAEQPDGSRSLSW